MPRTPAHPLAKVVRLLKVIPQMSRLIWVDGKDYVFRLYVRASWAARGLSIAATARFYYESRSQIDIKGQCAVGNHSIILVGNRLGSFTGPLLVIEGNVYIGDQVNIRASGGVIRIGNNVLIANNVSMVSSNHGTALGKPIVEQTYRRGDIVGR